MTTEPTASPKTKRIILLIFLGIFLLVIIWMGLKTWRIYQAGQALLAQKAEVETWLADGLTNIDPDKAEALVMDARQHIKTLKKETAVFMPITPYLGGLPKIGPTLANAPALMTMADSGVDAAAYAVRGLKPALVIIQNDAPSETSTLSQLSGVLVDANPDLVAASEKLAEVAAARAEITNVEALPWQLEALFAQADAWLPFAQEGLRVTAVMPEILGENGSRTYLLIAQNEDELRPTGGFISSAGTLRVENGEIQNLEMVDAYRIDNWAEKPYDFPPQPFYDYMDIDLFLFRDANFWPDLPTTAEKALDLYSYGQEVPPLDGLIAIDQEFLRLLVEATGPIYIEESDITINPQNTIETLQNAWGARETENNTEWYANRKAFIGIFAAAIIDHIQNDFGAVDPVILAKNMKTALAEKHLQLYLRDAEAMAVLDENGWNGRLAPPDTQDFLAVVDTNMGFNKTNIYVNRTVDYHVALNDTGAGKAELNVTINHTGQGSELECIQFSNENYINESNYLDLAESCYWSYLRVYVPGGSQLVSGSTHDIAGRSMRSGQAVHSKTGILSEQAGFTTWDDFLLVPYGQSVSTGYHYLLPQITTSQEDGTYLYQLTVRKQAGTKSDPATISVTLPNGSTLIDAQPKPNKIEGTNLLFEIILDSDKNISVTYQ